MLQYYFSLRHFRLINWSFFIHSTMPNIHPRLNSGIEPKFSDCKAMLNNIWFTTTYWGVSEMGRWACLFAY